MFKINGLNGRGKVHSGFGRSTVLRLKGRRRAARSVMLVLCAVLMAGCITACGNAEPVSAVLKPDVERIPQNRDEDAPGAEGALKGRDTLALTIEAMQEDGKDTALVEGKIQTKGLSFELPEGFFESKETKNLYVTRRYPLDAANICYVEMDADPALQYMTKEDYEEIVAQRLYPDAGAPGQESAEGGEAQPAEPPAGGQESAESGEGNAPQTADVPADFKITEFKEIKVDGIPGFKVKSTCTYNDLTITQTEYIVNADKTYILTYTMTNEYDRSDWFAASEKSIHVKTNIDL